MEEVLGSLKIRIRHMFKWARSEVREIQKGNRGGRKRPLKREMGEEGKVFCYSSSKCVVNRYRLKTLRTCLPWTKRPF